MRKNIALVLAGIALGCGGGAAAVGAATPHGSGPGFAGPRWEQFCEVTGAQVKDREPLNLYLAGQGQLGWELTTLQPVVRGAGVADLDGSGVRYAYVCFKRPAPR